LQRSGIGRFRLDACFGGLFFVLIVIVDRFNFAGDLPTGERAGDDRSHSGE
jgi:hypothetical protein